MSDLYSEPFVVNVIGEPDGGGYEIALVRGDYDHGKRSCGWPGPDKIVLFSSDPNAPSPKRAIRKVWPLFLQIAADECRRFNRKG